MSTVYFAGSNGRVKLSAGSNIVGPYQWRIEKKTGEVDNTNFESPADVNAVIHSEIITDNIADTMLTIESVIDHGTIKTEVIFPIGTTIIMDLLYDKTTAEGYHSVVVFVKGYSPGIMLKEKQSVNISCRIRGIMPLS